MDVLRREFDRVYSLIRSSVFGATRKNPEIAHHLFVDSLKVMKALGLSGLVLDNSANDLRPKYEISNGAGFNKGGEVPPELMRLLGFDRVVVGTVTADPWKGNDFRPRVWRFPKTGSLVNCLGLPGIGAEKVARRLEKYGNHGVPLTVNLMATPGKSGRDVLEDLGRTVSIMKNISYVDSWELNYSCPNTHGGNGAIDARAGNLVMLDDMVYAVGEKMRSDQGLYVKVSPDSTEADVDDIVRVGEKYRVNGYVTGNTTTEHLPEYIDVSPGKGGASGNAVWDASVRTQGYFAERVDKNVGLIACGGINSAERARERCNIGNCNEIRIFTGLIFKGTGLLRELRAG